ncbi:MAG: glycosyltransferase family 4 protein [Treponema sp.]|nr:glycosyltransferase family 4 protein [Treponema sp.]
MKIGVDTFACDGGKSGVGAYLSQLLRRIPPSGARFELFGWGYDRYAFSEDAPDLDFIPRCSMSGRSANAFWHICRYPRFARERGYNACFFPAAQRQPPLTSPCPTVGVAHDMAAYWGTRRTRAHLGVILRPIMPNSLRKMDRIIAVSEWVKKELVELAGVRDIRVEVVPNGVDHAAFFPRAHEEGAEILLQPFSFKRPYILYVSRVEHPVKNHAGLIRAFDIFKDRTGFPHRLVLAGSDSFGAEKVKAAAARAKHKSDIFFTGHFPVKTLPELYSGADFSVVPSMYEGFGMAALEAMACGIPVACARAASLPETTGHAALYFDPLDPRDMADRMVTLACDRERRDECARLGIERAAEFSWDKCAARTLAILNETAG